MVLQHTKDDTKSYLVSIVFHRRVEASFKIPMDKFKTIKTYSSTHMTFYVKRSYAFVHTKQIVGSQITKCFKKITNKSIRVMYLFPCQQK